MGFSYQHLYWQHPLHQAVEPPSVSACQDPAGLHSVPAAPGNSSSGAISTSILGEEYSLPSPCLPEHFAMSSPLPEHSPLTF